MDWKRLASRTAKKSNIRPISKLYKAAHIAGWLIFGISIIYFVTSNYIGETPVITAFGQLVITNILTGYLWGKRQAGKREFIYNVITFGLQIVALVFILFPEQGYSSPKDILMLVSWIPLVGIFTLINYLLVKRLSTHTRNK
jgi:hypothetical protein